MVSTSTIAVAAETARSVPQGETGGRSVPQHQQMPFHIGPSDVLSISVWNREELDRTVTVRPDGKVSFSLVGDITASGLTPLELQDVMEKALSQYINIIPGEVSVVVDEVHSYAVSVLGQVRLPGRFEFQKQVTVLDALAKAGGLTEFAASSRILVLRNYQGRTEKIKFDYQRWLKAKDDAAWVLLMPGDIIMVP
jgi:polysaccharide export outer membrane protein